MNKTIFSRSTPLFFAALLFIIIRISNDVPFRSNYLDHTLPFIIIELSSVIACTYAMFHINGKLVIRSIDRKIPSITTYFIVMILPAILVTAAMTLSHAIEHRHPDIRLITAPCIVAIMMNLWVYSWMKSSANERRYHEMRLSNERIRNESLSAEIRLLQAQYKPHFLFNMLNVIYFSIDEHNTSARDTVEHLSNLLRRQLYHTDGKVPLENELSVLKSYIELFRLRFGDTVQLSVDLDNCRPDIELYPHLLLPLVENAFKHVSGTGSVSVSLHTPASRHIVLRVSNTITGAAATAETTGGLGLKNLRRQLDIYYGKDGYRLDTIISDLKYEVTLELW